MYSTQTRLLLGLVTICTPAQVMPPACQSTAIGNKMRLRSCPAGRPRDATHLALVEGRIPGGRPCQAGHLGRMRGRLCLLALPLGRPLAALCRRRICRACAPTQPRLLPGRRPHSAPRQGPGLCATGSAQAGALPRAQTSPPAPAAAGGSSSSAACPQPTPGTSCAAAGGPVASAAGWATSSAASLFLRFLGLVGSGSGSGRAPAAHRAADQELTGPVAGCKRGVHGAATRTRGVWPGQLRVQIVLLERSRTLLQPRVLVALKVGLLQAQAEALVLRVHAEHLGPDHCSSTAR